MGRLHRCIDSRLLRCGESMHRCGLGAFGGLGNGAVGARRAPTPRACPRAGARAPTGRPPMNAGESGAGAPCSRSSTRVSTTSTMKLGCWGPGVCTCMSHGPATYIAPAPMGLLDCRDRTPPDHVGAWILSAYCNRATTQPTRQPRRHRTTYLGDKAANEAANQAANEVTGKAVFEQRQSTHATQLCESQEDAWPS